MKILALADLHAFTLDEIEKIYRINKKNIDLIVWLGDNDSYVIKKIKKHFRDIPNIGVLGNYETHDNLTENGVLNINKKREIISDLSFVGLEGCFKEDDRFKYGYTQKESILTSFRLPEADILISHTSPVGIHQNKPNHPGLIGISDYIKIHSPRFVFHGHQHISKSTLLKNGTLVVGVFGGTLIDTEDMSFYHILTK